MSSVQLQVKPRRVRASAESEPPPFRFTGAQRADEPKRTGAARVAQLTGTGTSHTLRWLGLVIDAGFFLTCITVWCAVHLAVWSYAFQMGPAAACFGLPCPTWLRAKVLIACGVLAVVSFVLARVLTRFRHSATAAVLLLLVTLDVAALLLLTARAFI